MAKIDRYNGNLKAFASEAQGTERTLFGDTTQANDLTSQITTSFLRGWGIVGPSDEPSLEDFNGAMYTHGQLLAYLHQVGMPEYNALQEYHIGSLCNVSGMIYKSLINSNIGNQPSSSPAQWSELYQQTQVGETRMFRTTTPPVGFLEENGAAVSRTTYSSLFQKLVTDAGYTPQNFTVTIASPGLFTKAGHGFAGGERLRLSTTGSLPSGLNTISDYYVEVASANTFWLQALDGTRITTTGTQSGTHSYLQSWYGLGDGVTTFNLPDSRGEFPRGWDHGRGVDAGRQFGSRQLASIMCSGDISSTSAVLATFYNTLNDDADSYKARLNSDGNTPPLSGVTVNTIASTGNQSAQAVAMYMRPRNTPYMFCIKY